MTSGVCLVTKLWLLRNGRNCNSLLAFVANRLSYRRSHDSKPLFFSSMQVIFRSYPLWPPHWSSQFINFETFESSNFEISNLSQTYCTHSEQLISQTFNEHTFDSMVSSKSLLPVNRMRHLKIEDSKMMRSLNLKWMIFEDRQTIHLEEFSKLQIRAAQIDDLCRMA